MIHADLSEHVITYCMLREFLLKVYSTRYEKKRAKMASFGHWYFN